MTLPPRGGLAWGHADRDPAYQLALAGWHTVILNEANWTRELVQQLKHNGVRRVGVSFGRSVFVDAAGNPSAYWPVQQRIHAAAQETGGWVRDRDDEIVQTTTTPRAWLYDLARPSFRHELAGIFADWIVAEAPDLVMFDELHVGLVGIPVQNPDGLRDPHDWTVGAAQMLRFMARRIAAAGVPLPPIGTNGTFRVDQAPGIIRWHYWQNVTLGNVWRVQQDREAHPDTELMIHTAGAEVAPLAANVAAGVRASCWDWHPQMGMPFDRVWPIPVEAPRT